MTETLFQALFAAAPDVVAEAPGHVDLLGAHGDDHEGPVLTAAIPLRAHAAWRRRPDETVRVHTRIPGEPAHRVEYPLGGEGAAGDDLVAALTARLAAAGVPLPGMDLLLTSELPLGRALGSRAALAIATLRALRAGLGWSDDDVSLAELAAGTCTPRSALGCSLGQPGVVLLLDPTAPPSALPLSPVVELVVLHTPLTPDEIHGRHADRRRECEAAAQVLGSRGLGGGRAVGLTGLAMLPRTLQHRVRHVLTETVRVRKCAAALLAEDLLRVGALLHESHVSLRLDYEEGATSLDALAEAARADGAVVGARPVLGERGGVLVVLALRGHGVAVAQRLAGAEPARQQRTTTATGLNTSPPC